MPKFGPPGTRPVSCSECSIDAFISEACKGSLTRCTGRPVYSLPISLLGRHPDYCKQCIEDAECCLQILDFTPTLHGQTKKALDMKQKFRHIRWIHYFENLHNVNETDLPVLKRKSSV